MTLSIDLINQINSRLGFDLAALERIDKGGRAAALDLTVIVRQPTTVAQLKAEQEQMTGPLEDLEASRVNLLQLHDELTALIDTIQRTAR
jgi:hypothetical protein